MSEKKDTMDATPLMVELIEIKSLVRALVRVSLSTEQKDEFNKQYHLIKKEVLDKTLSRYSYLLKDEESSDSDVL